MDNLKNKKLFLLDMDGTIYLGNKLFDGTFEFLKYINDVGGRYMFLTNNSSMSVDKYIERLKKMGIKTSKEDYYTSTNATIVYLKQQKYKKIYSLGTKSFKEQLLMAGLIVVDRIESGIDCLCMGFDTELTFQKLEDACILLNNDIAYIATNPDLVCPTEYGYVPDCGSVSEIVFNATKKRPLFIGKPQKEMINFAIEKSAYCKEQTIIFGDRLYTDIASGFNAGITTAFVLSGEGTIDDVGKSDVKPDYIFDSIAQFTKIVKRG